LRLDAPLPKLISATPANPPLTELDIREIALIAGKRYSGDYGSRDPHRGYNLWAKGQTSELTRGALSWCYEITSWLGYVVLGAVVIVSYLRMVQTRWYNKQLVRLDRGLCPGCEYDLSGTESGPCPECGCDPIIARREVTRALGLG
jgi:hypothetical protein